MWKRASLAAAMMVAALATACFGQVPEPSPSMDGARNVQLTLYSQDFALVHERRPVTLAAGQNRLSFADVSKQLDPHSVLLRWAGPRDAGPVITGHSYDVGFRNAEGLLRLQTGKEVELVHYSDGREVSRDRGVLVASEGSSPQVIEMGGRLVLYPDGTLVMRAPEGVSALPQLAAEIEAGTAQAGSIELVYLTRGLRWDANYVAVFAANDESHMDLECCATITNRTGVGFPNASVVLAAGAPNRAVRSAEERSGAESQGYTYSATYTDLDIGVVPRSPGLRFENVSGPAAVAEMHAYPVKRPATIPSERLTRLPMLSARGLEAARDYSYRAPTLSRSGSPQQEHGAVATAIALANSPKNGLGVPLPAGTIRVYEADQAGRLHYAGAADIPATPRGRKATVTLSNAFDLAARYRTVSSKRLGRHKARKEIEVALTNERPRPATVRVVQPFEGAWSIAGASHKHRKLNSATAEWALRVPAGAQTRLRFTADLTGP